MPVCVKLPIIFVRRMRSPSAPDGFMPGSPSPFVPPVNPGAPVAGLKPGAHGAMQFSRGSRTSMRGCTEEQAELDKAELEELQAEKAQVCHAHTTPRTRAAHDRHSSTGVRGRTGAEA